MAKRPGYGPQIGYVKRPPAGLPTQKSVRLSPDLIERIEERAMKESIALGLNVDFTTLTRRGLELVLKTPVPELPDIIECNLVPISQGKGTRCVTCGASAGGNDLNCSRLNGKVVTR